MRLSKEELVNNFKQLGVKSGDVILIRASVGSVGRIEGSVNTFINALLECIGDQGTIISLAFTSSSLIKKPLVKDAFDLNTKSYAGALPNAMLKFPGGVRSSHPTCSYVAIGKDAELLTKNHDPESPAYEPIREIINLEGKCLLVGCVANSPGFTTTHLAEYDLGLLNWAVFKNMSRTYYKNSEGKLCLFKRRDPGLCSRSFYKFYSHYIRAEILSVGYIGKAYSILAPAKESYEIDKTILANNRYYNVCDSKDCLVCNAGRWDRLHKMPGFFIRRAIKYLLRK